MNPYAPTILTKPGPVQEAVKSKRRFRWQIIPATLTFFAALIPLAIAVIITLGWLEYRQSDRYDPSRPLSWILMELSLVPISLGAVVFLSLSGLAWVRQTPTRAIALFIAGFLLLACGLLMRV